jgi:hypothetical protein
VHRVAAYPADGVRDRLGERADAADGRLAGPRRPDGAAGPVGGAHVGRLAVARDAARLQLERGTLADELAPLGVVLVRQERPERHVDEVRVAVECIAVGERELHGLDLEVDEVGARRVEPVEIVALQKGELLQRRRPLRPRPAFEHRVAAVLVRHRRLDGGLPARHVLAREHAFVRPTRHVHDFLGAAETVDRVGYETLRPGPPGALDLRHAVSARALGLGEDALVGLGHLGVGEDLARLRHRPARQVQRGRRRPVLAEEVLHGVDGGADALDQGIAVPGVADRRREHVA